VVNVSVSGGKLEGAGVVECWTGGGTTTVLLAEGTGTIGLDEAGIPGWEETGTPGCEETGTLGLEDAGTDVVGWQPPMQLVTVCVLVVNVVIISVPWVEVTGHVVTVV